ncbi:thiosulfate ABC transporter substrate-binding protein CysP [Vibrio palustris]|uniref:Thiosulfate-binding protein n=1 Tax=Vibrio palustris TaxID=1918946 RepID=A0A1R4B6F8_9VIBR|nr:thiosulfate ABC transporter substrate-binding protein CysP [Vibrio palustris]SJL84498.1 Thiosulfate-binding protein precursor [Vibrio palustris]
MKYPFSKTLLASVLLASSFAASAAEQTLLNSSYDIARELFASYNPLFKKHWKEETGNDVTIKQSHSGSSTQARAILQGMPADVVTFNQVTDVQVLHDKGNLIPANWQSKFPNNSSPYYSTTAFLVRKGNPKNIHSWKDLARDGVSSVFPNPKTSGNGRYTYLAALGYAQKTFGKDDIADQNAYLKKMLRNVAVFDTGGRGATTSFVERGLGDVLLTFESEVNNIRDQYGSDKYEVVVPKTSILAEFPVAVVDANAKSHGTEKLAHEYLNYLYSKPAQRLLASFNYRVDDKDVLAEEADRFPKVDLMTVKQITGGWPNAMKTQFSRGARLDQLQRR